MSVDIASASRRSWGYQALKEGALFSFLVFGFLSIYSVHYHAPLSMWPAHLARVLPVFMGVLGLRYVVVFLLKQKYLARFFDTLLAWLLLLVLLCYYSLVFISISSWGRVITWPLIAAYAQQGGYLLDVLAIPNYVLYALLAGLLSLLLLSFAVAMRFTRRHHWLANLSHGKSRYFTLSLALGAIFFALLMGFAFMQKPSGGEVNEPIALTFFYDKFSKDLQSHSMQASSKLNHEEDIARQAYAPVTDQHHPNVVLIVVDALRARQLSMYGYERHTSPYLQHLYEQNQLHKVDATHSICAESACGLMGLGSARYVHQFIEKPFLLSEALQRNGFAVHLILGGDHTSFYNLKQAYGATDSYFDAGMASEGYRNDDKALLSYLQQFPPATKQPAYLQFHLMSVHALGTRHPEFAAHLPVENYYRDLSKMFRKEPLGPVAARINYYDNGVRQADAMIESILQILKNKGYLEKALVVITADHGESLGEHQRYGHVEGVFEPMLHIPLLFQRIGFAGTPVSAFRNGPNSQVDVAPTIMQELGLPSPATWQGTALQKKLAKDQQFLFFEQQHEHGLLDWQTPGNIWKYWRHALTLNEHAFELVSDPLEAHDQMPVLGETLKRQWRRLLTPLQAKAVELKKAEELPQLAPSSSSTAIKANQTSPE